jgi:CRISPR/Cas system endoribonuclease Cas6 (RAMP superfamily)
MIELYPMRSGRQTPKPSQECVFKRQRLGSG